MRLNINLNLLPTLRKSKTIPLFPHRRLWCTETDNFTINRVQCQWKCGSKWSRSLAKKLPFGGSSSKRVATSTDFEDSSNLHQIRPSLCILNDTKLRTVWSPHEGTTKRRHCTECSVRHPNYIFTVSVKFLPLRTPNQNSVFLSSHTCQSPASLAILSIKLSSEYCTNVQFVMVLNMQFSAFPCNLLSSVQIFPSTSCSQKSPIHFSLSDWGQVFRLYIKK